MWALTVRAAVPAVDGRRRGRLLRAAHPRLHAALGRAARTPGMRTVVKDRLNALKNPYAHLHQPDISTRAGRRIADALGSRSATPRPARPPTAPARWCSRSESAAAKAPGKPAWVHAHRHALRADDVRRPRSGEPAGRAATAPPTCTRQAGITNPRKEIDCAEIYVPFSWFEAMWMENLGIAPVGEGWKMVQEGATAMDGDFPVNMSGGVLSSNPIGASGMIRFAEAAMQVRGTAGEHQLDGVRKRARPRLRRRLAVLLDVDRRQREAVMARHSERSEESCVTARQVLTMRLAQTSVQFRHDAIPTRRPLRNRRRRRPRPRGRSSTATAASRSASSTSARRSSRTTSARRASARATASASISTTATNTSRARWPPSSSAPRPSTSTSATSKKNSATSATTPTSSR